MHNISIFHRVLFAFYSELPRLATGLLRLKCLKIS